MVEREPQRTQEEGAGEGEQSPPPALASKLSDPVPSDVRDVSFHAAVRGYERREVDRYVQRVNRVIAELEITRSPESAVRNALDRVGEQTSGILQRARETADEIVHTARAEAEETIGRAGADAHEIVAGARAQAERIGKEAAKAAQERREQGERELAAARKQAEEARMSEEHLLEESRARAEREMQALRASTDMIAEERNRLGEAIHELAAQLDALGDSAAAAASHGTDAEDGLAIDGGVEVGSEHLPGGEPTPEEDRDG